MNDTEHRPTGKYLHGFAALIVSIASLLPLFWGFSLLRYQHLEDIDLFSSILSEAALLSFYIVVIGAFAVARFWRGDPLDLAMLASAPYFVLASADIRASEFSFWSTAGVIVFAVFYAIARLCRFFPKPPDHASRKESPADP